MSATMFRKTTRCGKSLTAAVIRCKHTLIPSEGRLAVDGCGVQQQQQQQQMHQVVSQPDVCSLPPPSIIVPPNVQMIESSKKAQFSVRRVRETSNARLATVGELYNSGVMRMEGVKANNYNFESIPKDNHMAVYDCNDTVSLDSSIQTNVPKPYELSDQAPSHFSSPDCHGEQEDKYVAGDLQDHHHISLHKSSKKNSGIAWGPFDSCGVRWNMWGVSIKPVGANFHSFRHYGTICFSDRLVVARMPPVLNSNLVHCCPNNSIQGIGCLYVKDFVAQERRIHNCMAFRAQERKNGEGGESETPQSQLTSRQKLQRAVKEYGSTVIVFHVAISLTSLGICYLLVSSGVDMTGLIKALGINLKTGGESVADVGAGDIAANQLEQVPGGDSKTGEDPDVNTKRAAGAATFVVAYAVHKVFAPARIAATLTATPFIVRYLRRIGFLKPPKPNL